jgi:hypothetical protein
MRPPNSTETLLPFSLNQRQRDFLDRARAFGAKSKSADLPYDLGYQLH